MSRVVGIDEAGRGPWAGPIIACAVSLNDKIDGLDDSKQLTKHKREQLARSIRLNADIGVGWISSSAIDQIGLTRATAAAMSVAYSQIKSSDDYVIIDGNTKYLEIGEEAIVKADSKFNEVAAASIIAKTARDSYMTMLSTVYPQYSFDKHAGYGTKAHTQAILKHGICDQHRKSFKPIAKLIN